LPGRTFLIVQAVPEYVDESHEGDTLTYLFDMGVTTGSMRQYYEHATPDDRVRVLSTANTFLLVAGAVITALVWVLAPQLADVVLGSGEFVLLVWLVIGRVTTNTLMTIGLLDLRVRGQRRRYVALTLGRTAVAVSLNLCFVVVLELGAAGILLGQFLAAVAVAALIVPQSWRRFAVGRVDWTDLKGMLGYGLPFVPTLFATWVIDMAGRILLERHGTLSDVGIFSLGQRVAMIMLLVVTAFRFDWGRLALSIHGDPESRYVYSRVLTYYVFVAVFLGLGLVLYSGMIFRLLVDQRYWAALRVIPMMTLAHILFGAYSVLLIGTAISRTSWTQIIVVGLGAMISVVLNLLFIPKYGMMATAWSVAAAYIWIVVGTYWFAQRHYPIRYELGRLAQLAVVGLFIYAVSLLIRGVPALAGIFLRSLLMLSFPACLLVTGFLRSDEKRALATLRSSVPIMIRNLLVSR
jgi:O-antigen/teichoic acid export membrane protein